MTHPITDDAAAPQPKAESFVDWFHINSRWIGVGAVVVLLGLFAAWYITRSRTLRNENADKQLLVAKQSVASGNVPLAESDLRKVADRFQGTPAGAEAGLMLGQLRLEKGDYQGAVTYLQELAGKVKDGPSAAGVRGLLGDAYAQLGKTAEAAAEYERGAALTNMPNEKMYLLSKAGHAYQSAGRQPEAKKVWEILGAQSDNPAIAAEARVRLGEIAAGSTRS